MRRETYSCIAALLRFAPAPLGSTGGGEEASVNVAAKLGNLIYGSIDEKVSAHTETCLTRLKFVDSNFFLFV